MRAEALVTAEAQGELLAVALPSGKVVRRVRLPASSTTVASGPNGPVIAVSPSGGLVTLLSYPDLHRIAVLRDFRSPQIAAVTPDGEWALVSDADGTLSTIELATHRIVDRIQVGAGAHHMAVGPDQHRVWVALGETAHTVVVVDCSDPRHLRVIRRLHPPAAVHDLAFGPGGATVWASSADAAAVWVFAARGGRLVGRVSAGRAPQHVAFIGSRAYIASGYGSSIEMVDASSHRVLARAGLPYGSFNLAVWGPDVVTTSLLDGRVTVLRASDLHRIAGQLVADEARSVAIAAVR
jgi:DNA-binding beta-propeller fold protein YncE